MEEVSIGLIVLDFSDFLELSNKSKTLHTMEEVSIVQVFYFYFLDSLELSKKTNKMEPTNPKANTFGKLHMSK